eukprot:7195784-Pyramimonas_sp.AAC.1
MLWGKCAALFGAVTRTGVFISLMQRLLGFTRRLPVTLLSDISKPIDPECLSTDPLQDFHRAEDLRRGAMNA